MKSKIKDELDEAFVEACENGDFQAIKNLLENQKQPKKNIFLSFLSLFQTPQPKVSFFNTVDDGFLTLCKNGHTEIVSYILSNPAFIDELNAHSGGIPSDNDYFQDIASGFFLAAANGHFDCANLMTSYVNECENSISIVHDEFVSICALGNLSYVKFLCTHPDLTYNGSTTFNYRLDELRPTNEAFINACEKGHLDVVKYLISDENLKVKVDLNFIENIIEINNPAMIRYFIFDLNLPRSHKFLSKIICEPEDLIDTLIDKRELFEEVTHNLDEKNNLMPPKKMKI